MRVIAGRFRGRPVDAPAGRRTRPITDRAKEDLFNILGARLATPGGLPAAPALDLFAGSGALGIEALSRGATSCIFVERDRGALRALRSNVARLGLGEGEAVVAVENAWTLRIPPAPGDGYGLVFVDPPYRDAADAVRVADLLERIVPRLAPDAVVVFRQDAADPPPTEFLMRLDCVDERRIGDMRILLLSPRSGSASGGDREGGAAGAEQVDEEARADDIGDDADGQLEP